MSDPLKPPSPGKSLGKDDEVVERRTLRDYYIVIRERLWLALPLALLVAIGVAYYQSRATPLYQSTASFKIDRPETIVTTQGVVSTGVDNDLELNTYLQVIRGSEIRNRVLASLTPEERQILQRPYLKDLRPGAPPPGIDLGSMDVQPRRNTFVVDITVSHRDPQAAALLANRYVQQFIESLLDKLGGTNDYAVQSLRSLADQNLAKANEADQRLQDYMRAQNLVSLDSSTNIVQARLTAANAALQSARLTLLGLQEQYDFVKKYQAEGRDLLEINYIANYGVVPALNQQLQSLKRDQALLSERYLSRHPKMIESANAIAVTTTQLNAAIALAIADLKTNLDGSQLNAQSLEKEYNDQVTAQLHLRDLAIQYNSLANQAAVARSNYTQTLDRLSQLTTSKYLEKIPIHPFEVAYPSGAPYTPNLQAIVKNAVVLAVVVFFGVAIGLSFLDDKVKSAWDVESFIGANLLGIIPDLANLETEEKYRLVLEDKKPSGVEPFLGIYSSVKIHSKVDFPKSLLVTSTIPGEGKSLVSGNLAASFARHGKSVLLIDCDLRRPVLHRHFNLSNETGIVAWFEKGAKLDDDITRNPDLGIASIAPNFSVISSGGRSKSPTPILESPVFGQLLERLKKHFDLIVIDSPPLGVVTDSLLIAERVDEVIYVCRFNRATRKHIRLYIRTLRAGKTDLIGVVLNGLSERRIEYYSNYRYYRSYKKYYGTQD